MATQAQTITTIENSLQGRYYTNSLSLLVIVGLVVFVLFLLQIIKIVNKMYAQSIHSSSAAHTKYLPSSKEENRPQPHPTALTSNQQQLTTSEVHNPNSKVIKTSQFTQKTETMEELTKTKKEIKFQSEEDEMGQEWHMKLLYRSSRLIRENLPLLPIVAVNVAMLASYEYLTVSLCAFIILTVILEILNSKQDEYSNAKFFINIFISVIVVSWTVNLFTVGMPV